MGFATIAGLIVSILALVATASMGMLRFTHERRLDDRADARAILAEGAFELGRMKHALRNMLTEFNRPLETSNNRLDEFRVEIGGIERAAETLESVLAATRLRFTRGSVVVVELSEAQMTARLFIGVCFLARRSGVAEDKKREWRERKSPGRYREALDLSLEFDTHRDAYLVAAQKIVGVDLASD